MDYNTLLDIATDLGYRLAMCGAETFRVEESINLILKAYGLEAEVFAIPNCLTVSIKTADGKPMTRMRRIGYHGNDLDSVERYSNLSRRICTEKPDPDQAVQWLKETDASRRRYNIPQSLFGNFLGACGFAIFFGSCFTDSLVSGLCGILVGIVGMFMDKLKANQFFRTIVASFLMGLATYSLKAVGIVHNPDSTIIGTLMILVPGLLFTNAMRDIMYGDTNSGMNRVIQVFLIAVGIALGTGAAWAVTDRLWGIGAGTTTPDPGIPLQLIGSLIGCIGFTILFNIHGPGGLLCALGGVLSWSAYCLTIYLGGSELSGYFFASVVAALYAEIMARIRKYPAISYLVVSIFPLIPGASVYYTMTYAVRGDMQLFANRGMITIAIAGVIAAGILMISTSFRMLTVWRRNRKKA